MSVRTSEITYTVNRDLEPGMLKGKKCPPGGDGYLERFSRLTGWQYWEK